eukprot:3785734-Amphidinium_carterae.1
MGPPPTPLHRKGQGKAPIAVETPVAGEVIPPWRLPPVAKAQAPPCPVQDVVEVLDVDSEDSWGHWGSIDEPEMMRTLDFLKEVALDWSAEDWSEGISNKHAIRHWFREILHIQLGTTEIMIRLDVCSKRFSTYRCLPE